MLDKRRGLALLLLPALLAFGVCRSRPRPRHIVALCSIPSFTPIFDGLKAQLERIGFVERVHVTYELRFYDASASESAEGLSVAVRHADLIFAFPTEAAIVARKVAAQLAPDVPVVFAYAGIERSGLVTSVRAPGGNVTGVRFPGPEQIGKRLEIIHAIAPRARRVWVGYQRDYANSQPALSILRPLALAMRVELVEVPVDTLDELQADLDRRDRSGDPGMDAIILMPDHLNHSPRGWQLIKAFAARHDLPLGGSFLYTVEEGAVFGNANDLANVGELAAPLVAKILDGIPAGTIPVVTPEQDLYVNHRRAQELGLRVPEGLLRQAAVIIR